MYLNFYLCWEIIQKKTIMKWGHMVEVVGVLVLQQEDHQFTGFWFPLLSKCKI